MVRVPVGSCDLVVKETEGAGCHGRDVLDRERLQDLLEYRKIPQLRCMGEDFVQGLREDTGVGDG